MKRTPYISGPLEGSYERRTLRLDDEVALNIGPGEALVGIEILDATHVFGAEELPDLVVENVRLAVSGWRHDARQAEKTSAKAPCGRSAE
jgi:hypothetical protein